MFVIYNFILKGRDNTGRYAVIFKIDLLQLPSRSTQKSFKSHVQLPVSDPLDFNLCWYVGVLNSPLDWTTSTTIFIIWLLRNHLGFRYPFQLILLKSQLLPIASLHRNSLGRYQPAEWSILLDNLASFEEAAYPVNNQSDNNLGFNSDQ